MEKITTVIRTSGPEDTVFINGVVAKEIARINKKHEGELRKRDLMLSGMRRERFEGVLECLHDLKRIEENRNERLDELLRIAMVPWCMAEAIGEAMDNGFMALFYGYRDGVKKLRRGFSRNLMRFLDFCIRHDLIAYEEE